MRIHLGTWFVLLSFTSTAAATGGGPGEPLEAPSLARSRPAQEGGFSPRKGFYFDVHGMWAQLGGDFDGDTVLLSSTGESIEIPDADSGVGFGLAFGHRWNRHAIELAFNQTRHDGAAPSLPGGDITYSAVDFDWRYFFRPEERLQPFFQAGFGFAFATLEDSSMGTSVGDADLSGLELGLGGGAEYYLSERWSLGLRALYRQAFFDTAEGVDGDSGSIDESVDGGGLALVLGVSFTL